MNVPLLPNASFVVALAICLAPDRARATVIATESFNYAAGAHVDGLNGGSGWVGPWQTSAHFTADGQDNTITSNSIPGRGAFARLAVAGSKLTTLPSNSTVTTGGNGTGIRSFRQVDLARLTGTGILDPATGKRQRDKGVKGINAKHSLLGTNPAKAAKYQS